MGMEMPGILKTNPVQDVLLKEARAISDRPTRPAADQSSEQQQASRQELENQVKALEKTFLAFNRRVELSVNDTINQVIIKVVDADTDTVIKEIPAEEIQHLIARIKEDNGTPGRREDLNVIIRVGQHTRHVRRFWLKPVHTWRHRQVQYSKDDRRPHGAEKAAIDADADGTWQPSSSRKPSGRISINRHPACATWRGYSSAFKTRSTTVSPHLPTRPLSRRPLPPGPRGNEADTRETGRDG